MTDGRASSLLEKFQTNEISRTIYSLIMTNKRMQPFRTPVSEALQKPLLSSLRLHTCTNLIAFTQRLEKVVLAMIQCTSEEVVTDIPEDIQLLLTTALQKVGFDENGQSETNDEQRSNLLLDFAHERSVPSAILEKENGFHLQIPLAEAHVQMGVYTTREGAEGAMMDKINAICTTKHQIKGFYDVAIDQYNAADAARKDIMARAAQAATRFCPGSEAWIPVSVKKVNAPVIVEDEEPPLMSKFTTKKAKAKAKLKRKKGTKIKVKKTYTSLHTPLAISKTKRELLLCSHVIGKELTVRVGDDTESFPPAQGIIQGTELFLWMYFRVTDYV